MICFSEADACVMYLRDKRTAYIAMEGFIKSDTIRNCFQSLKRLCAIYRVDYILIDSSRLDIIKKEDVQWILENLGANLGTNKLPRIAYIKPNNLFGEISAEKIFKGVPTSRVRKFPKIEMAEYWMYQYAED